ncbi:MAG: putative toxin [Acidobacteria bacterium]|nr:putative toxin [Acidobacteriota bacterium]
MARPLCRRARTFTYNNLGWLLTATNPESGTITYDHDANSKVISRTSADNSIVTMNYDALGRIIRKTFTGPRTSSPQTFCYDGDTYIGSDCAVGTVLNGLGRMTEARNDVSSTKYLSFDAVGRIKQSQQTTGTSGPHLFAYSYNLAGMREQMTMPSTRVVNTTYDAMGRVSGANWGTAPRSITGIQYWANGAQNLLNLQFDYCGTGPLIECASNNGNVIRQLSTAGLSWNHGYSYDGWNRLTGYTEGGSAMEGYGFDEFGNRWLTSRSTALPGLTGLATTSSWFNAKNRLLDPIQAPNESTYYDAAGNQIRIGAMNLTYDGEGRVAGATNTGSGVVTYDYDAADKRVRSTVSGVSTVYVYEASGELAAEYGGSATTSGPEFLTGDHLGSVRLVTDGAGAVKQRRDYGPFGEELETASRTAILGYGTGGQRHRFTGKERDLETGLDYFGARYLASSQGRWTSPDEFSEGVGGAYEVGGARPTKPGPLPYANLELPQSLNKYSYALNNPLRYIDPDGHCVEDACLAEGAALIALAKSPAGQRLLQTAEAEAQPLLRAGSQMAGQALAKSGQALELLAQQFNSLSKNTERILQGQANGAAYRVPDLLTKGANGLVNFVGEVKDVTRLNLTKQLGDLFNYAKDQGTSLNLYVRNGAAFSQKLLQQISDTGSKVHQYVDKEWVDVTSKVLKDLKR